MVGESMVTVMFMPSARHLFTSQPFLVHCFPRWRRVVPPAPPRLLRLLQPRLVRVRARVQAAAPLQLGLASDWAFRSLSWSSGRHWAQAPLAGCVHDY